MNTTVLIFAGILLLIAVVFVFILLRQSQQLRLGELSSRERLSAKESELDNLSQALERIQLENQLLNEEVQSRREVNAKLSTSLELERKQFEDKMALLNESKETLTVAIKNSAHVIFVDNRK